MGDTYVYVDTPATDRELFESLAEEYTEWGEGNKVQTELKEVCNERIDRPERIGWLAEQATHIVRVYEDEELMTFGYLNVNPAPEYVELILLCGRYKIGRCKGSELVVGKAIQIARTVGAKEIRLEALNQDLVEKVYKPMGFVPVDESEPDSRYLKLPLPPEYGGSHRLRLNVKRRGTQRHRGGRKHRKLRKLTTRRR